MVLVAPRIGTFDALQGCRTNATSPSTEQRDAMTTQDSGSDATGAGTTRDAARSERPAPRQPADVAVERTPVVEAGPKAVRTMTLPGTAGAPKIVERQADRAVDQRAEVE